MLGNFSPGSLLSTAESEFEDVDLVTSSGMDYKAGSLQEFVPSVGPIENFSPDLFSAGEIHKIAVLDMRLLNLDRNACNILV